MTELSQTRIDQLVKLAQSRIVSDNEDFMIYDYSGGNIDDAYSLGRDVGEVWLARDILNELNIDYKS